MPLFTKIWHCSLVSTKTTPHLLVDTGNVQIWAESRTSKSVEHWDSRIVWFSSQFYCGEYLLIIPFKHLVVLSNGPSKSEACRSGRSLELCEELILTVAALLGFRIFRSGVSILSLTVRLFRYPILLLHLKSRSFIAKDELVFAYIGKSPHWGWVIQRISVLCTVN